MAVIGPVVDVRRLVEPDDTPYDDLRGLDRARRLLAWYGDLERDRDGARRAARFALSGFSRYLSTVAWTEDEKAARLTRKPFPPYEYIHHLANFWDERTPEGLFAHDQIVVPKSRQLMLSWLAVHWLLYNMLRRPSGKALIVSRTEDHGLELMQRVRLAYDSLPAWFLRELNEPLDSAEVFKVGRSQFRNRSVIKVLPEKGGKSPASYSANIYLLDEAALQEYFGETWATVQGGQAGARGRTSTIAISTARTDNMGFYNLVADNKDGVLGGVARRWHDSTGLQIYRNQLNGVDVCRVHYTADPMKRSVEWKAAAMRGFSSDLEWRREMEIDFFAFSGKRIFEMLDPTVQMLKSAARIEQGMKGRQFLALESGGREVRRPALLGLGIDHGLQNPCGALWKAVVRNEDQVAYRDYSVAGRAASDNALAIKRLCGEERYQWQVIDGQHRLPNNTRLQVADLYRYREGDRRHAIMPGLRDCKKGPGSVNLGINRLASALHAAMAVAAPEHPYWKLHGFDERAVEEFANRPCLMISPTCQAFWQELELARWKEIDKDGLNQPEQEVDAHNHVRKASAYLDAAGMRWAA